MNLNASPMDLISSDDGDQCHKPFGSNNQGISSLSSSSSVACHIFFNQNDQDQAGYSCHHRLYQLQYQEDGTYASQGGLGSGSSCEMKNKVENTGFKLSLESETNNIKYPVKWMSSKMRLMHKMKNPDRFPLKITSTSNIDVTTNLEDHNVHQISSAFEIDLSSNNSSYNSSSSCPVRVCSDCSTTKTPLWRSGPKGPKSLCNACGIRQRKARRALAAAAAAVSTVVSSPTDQPSAMKIKLQQKDKTTVKNGNVTQLKKRFKMAAAGGGGGSPSNVLQKKLGFEDFLINLSKNLKFHRVFPEDEKDAAILLMALSSGLVHG